MIVDKLAKKNIVKRIPNPVDTRAKLLVITPYGKSLVKTIEDSLNTTLIPLLNGLSKDELSVIQKVLEVIIKNEDLQ
jgi:DNA-binding MarR family transcriptional regulator